MTRLTRAVCAALVAGAVALSCCPQACAAPTRTDRSLASLPAATSTPEQNGVEVRIEKVTPTAASPGDVITVTGSLQNTGSTTLEDLDFQLWSRNGALETREDIENWADGTFKSDGQARGIPDRPASPVPPGGKTSFTVSVPVGAMELYDSEDFGARGLAVVVKGDRGSGLTELTSRRTFVIWTPSVPEHVPTDLSIVVPITSQSPVVPTEGGDPQILTSMAPGGRLDKLLRAVKDKAFSWAVDPSLIDQVLHAQNGPSSMQVMSDTNESTGRPRTNSREPIQDDARGSAWLETLRVGAHVQSRTVTALPYGDPDLVALARAGGETLLSQAQGLSQVVMTEALGASYSGALALPAVGRMDFATANMLAATAGRKVVLSSSAQPLLSRPGYTPTARTRISTVHGGISGLVSDDALSQEMAETGGQEPAAATQRLLADLAAITTERPGESRHVLISLPRGWDPDPQAVQTAMSTLRGSSWVRLRSLDSLAARSIAGPARGSLAYSQAAQQAELPRDHVDAVVNQVARLDSFLPSVMDPAGLLQDYHAVAFCLLSVSRRSAISHLAHDRRPLLQGIETLYRGIDVPTGSSLNLLARTADLPVTIENKLGVAVRVVVALRPRSGRLVVDTPVRVEVGASSRRQVRIPIRAVANGDVRVDTTISSPTGVVLLTAPSTMVKVHNDWEGRVLLVAGGLLGLLVAVGLIRTVRRGRVRIPASAVPDPDEEATFGTSSGLPVQTVVGHRQDGPAPDDVPGSYGHRGAP